MRKTLDLSLYLVTDSCLNKKLNLIQIVEEAVAGGVSAVQLREKNVTAQEIRDQAVALLKVLKPKKIPLLINDFPQIAKEVGADGVHLGRRDMHARQARELLGSDAVIGISIESPEDFHKVDLSCADYIAASPVFPTFTKLDAGEPFYLEDLRTLCKKSSLPVIGIGGITTSNVRAVLETKVAGVAVVSAICAADSPKKAAQNLKNAMLEMRSTPYRVLTIAGSDSGGGAGIQADLKTFEALGCYGMSVVTALTAQNTVAVKSVFPVTPVFVREQLTAVLEDIGVDAVKVGMLFSKEMIAEIYKTLLEFKVKNIVLDPVMIAKSGDLLLLPDAIEALKTFLPLATVVTPNLPEARVLTGQEVVTEEEMVHAATLLNKQCKNVLLKGGHSVETAFVTDLLLNKEKAPLWLKYPRVVTQHTHGTGCTYSAAIAAHLAKGLDLRTAVCASREYLQRAIVRGALKKIGYGCGPLEHRCA